MDHWTEQYSTNQWGIAQARKARNARAKALRKEGFIVECRTWQFQDLARDGVFTLEAWMPGKKNPFGGRCLKIAPPKEGHP